MKNPPSLFPLPCPQGQRSKNPNQPKLDYIPPGPESALSPAILKFLRAKLDGCFSDLDHVDCHRDEGLHHDWPGRLLRIAREGAVSLVGFQTNMARQYAALSYCWGSPEELSRHPPLRATVATVQALRDGIQLNQLPRTIEQAVRVCIHLEIEYIWVDALCIIQDDGLDWEKESRKMATVYSEAKVTIIAASSTSCHSGFLHMDMGGIVLDTPPLKPLTPGASTRMVGRLASNRGLHIDELSPADSFVQDPIDNRGWTLQEQVLSTRCIRFTQDDAQWECRSKTACLCAQTQYRYLEVGRGPKQWARIPGHFNHRKFTLTRESIDWGTPTLGSGEDQQLIADSVNSYLSRLLCELVDTGTVPLSASDPLGPVADGFLTLRAPLVACVTSSLDGKNFAVTSTSDFAFTVEPFFCRFDCVFTRIELPGGGFTVARSQHRRAFDVTETTIALLRSVTRRNFTGSPTVGVEGLILGKCLARDGYQRLGYIQIKPPGDIDAMDWTDRMTEITIY